MAIEVREGQAAAARQMAQGAAASSRITAALCVCVRARANLRPNLETTSGEEIPCPDLSLTKHRFSVDLPILEIVRTNIRLYMQCAQILLKANLV